MDDLTFYALAAFVAGALVGYLLCTTHRHTAGVPHALLDKTEADLKRVQQLLEAKQKEAEQLYAQCAAAQQQAAQSQELLANQKEEWLHMQKQLTDTFEKTAGQLLIQRTQQLTATNSQQLESLINPLRERLRDFENLLMQQSRENSKERISLTEEIKQLKHLNSQLSQDAQSLVSALRGDNKLQGDWGEVQLVRLLEQAGLQEGTNFESQASFANTQGRQQRPDVIVYLPQNRHLIIDSKVSLVAWQQYCKEKDSELAQVAMQAHVAAIRNHIRELSNKAYPELKQLRAPDYTLMFVPIEPALIAALQYDDTLFSDALDRNIVLVSNTTLLATMRTVAFLWRQEKQQANALEIAQSAGALYDKFVAFTEDLRLIGQRIEQAGMSYKDAMNKLSESPRRADTLVGRVERLRELGARTQKRLAPDLLQEEAETTDS